MFQQLLKEESGFTLVELLVTIAILAVLFGVVTLSLSGVGTDAESDVQAAEESVVQSAIDIYMAQYNDSDVIAFNNPSGNSCLSTDPQLDDGTNEDHSGKNLSDYARLSSETGCVYSWGTDGEVSQDCTATCTP